MSELTLFLIRVSVLAILWIFVLSAVSVVRSDMVGSKATKPAKGAPAARQAKPRRGALTQVVIVEGLNAGLAVSLDRAPILIGRGNDAVIRLDDDYASTRHARIASANGEWYVEDLGSTNGTYIGTARITQPTGLLLGTKIRIGKTVMEMKK